MLVAGGPVWASGAGAVRCDDMPTIAANGIDVYYEQEGEGDDLLLIAGLGAHSGAWALNRPAFAQKFRVTVFDNRGAGRTSAADEPYSIRSMADDTAALLRAIGIDRTHVLGASLGGFVAQELGINYPGLVDRLVLACTRATTGELRRQIAIGQRALWESGISREAIAAIQQPWTSSTAVLQDPVKPLDALSMLSDDPYPIARHAYLGQLDAMLAHDTRDRLPQITAETLVIVGTADVLTPPYEAEEVAALIPKARMHVLPRGGHGFMREFPAEFNRAVLNFLKS